MVIRQVNTVFHVFGSLILLLDQLKSVRRQKNSASYEGPLKVATVIPSGLTPLWSVMYSYRVLDGETCHTAGQLCAEVLQSAYMKGIFHPSVLARPRG